jgi:hypothetical protein
MFKKALSHLKYLRYLARHKWYVLVAGLKIKAPLWRLLVHDLSKFRPGEFKPYLDRFYGTGRKSLTLTRNRFDAAWLAHQHRNPHHWQYWILREDNGATFALPMSRPHVFEMVADWAGAGRAIHGSWEIRPWYEANREKMDLHPDTRFLVEKLIYFYF